MESTKLAGRVDTVHTMYEVIVMAEIDDRKSQISAKQGEVIPRYIPLARWGDYFMHPTLGSLRWMVWRADHYGLAHCVKRVGRRVWIDQEAFWEWLGEQGG